jgi:hypothetical protein
MLTKETKLLIDHWSAVEEIIAAERQLRTQLAEFLRSLKSDLAKTDWWSDKWHFEPLADDQVFIAHANWRIKKAEFAIWLGVERFDPPALFGKETIPQLYLWSSVKQPELIAALRELYQAKSLELLGDVVERPADYCVRHFLPKSLPGQADGFEQTMRSCILEFFSFYAKQEKPISAEVARHFKA